MSLLTLYPKLHQWLSHGGEMLVRPFAAGGIEVLLGDTGGFPADASSHGDTLDDALRAADTKVADWLERTRQLQEDLVSDDLPELRSEEFIRVAGWPAIRNPHHRK